VIMKVATLMAVAAGLALPVAAETFKAVPVADAYIWMNYANRNYGASPHLVAGSASNRYNDDRFRGLIRWPLPEPLEGARVVSAKVTFHVRYSGPGAGTIDVYMLKAPWTEAATWKVRDGEHAWPRGYGALGATTGKVLARVDVEEVRANTNGELPTGETVVLDITGIARRWAAGAPNEGLLLRMVHVQYPQGNFCAYSRDMNNPDLPDLRPRLVIEYEPGGKVE